MSPLKELLQQAIPDLIAVIQLTKALQDMVWSNPFTAVGELVAGVQLALYIARKLRNHRRFW